MESRSSNIKINFDVNGASVQRTKDAIHSIQASAEKLSKTLENTLNKISKTMDAKDKRPGQDAKKSFSVMEKLLGTFDYKATERSISSTSASISKFVDRTIRDINRLKAAQDEVMGQRPDNIIGGQGWSYNMSERVGQVGSPTAPHVGSFESFIKSKTPWERFMGPYAGRSFWGEGGFEGYMGGRGAALGHTLGLGQPGATVFGALGTAIGRMGPYGAALAAGGYLANKAYEAFDETRPNQVQYTLDKRFLQLGAAGAVAGTHNRLFNSIQGGSISYLGAYRSALGDKEVQRSLNNAVLNRESLVAAAGLMPTSLTGKVGNVFDWLKNVASGGVGSMMEAIDKTGLEPVDSRRAKEILYQRAAFALTEKQQESLQQAVSSYHQFQGGYFNTMADRLKTDSYGRVNAMRMRGMSGAPGKNGEMAYEAWRSRLIAGGWDTNDDIQGYQALLGVGKGYGKVLSTTWGVVGGHMAGLTNIEQIVAAAGTIGGSVPIAGRLKGILQGSVGTGGLDVAVANKLYMDTLTSINQTGQWGPGNTANGYASLIAGMVSGGYDDKGRLMYDVGGQQRRMQMFTEGNKAYQSFVSGTAAPVFNAMSLYSGIKATGGTWGLGSEVIRNMDVRELASIVKGGDISDYYKFTLGDNTTKEGREAIRNMAQTQLKETNRNLFSGVKTSTLQDEGGRKFLQDVKDAYAKGRTLQDVIEDRTSTITDKRERILAQAGLRRGAAGILAGFYQDRTAQAYEGLLESSGEYAKKEWGVKLDARGVGVGAPKGLEKEALKAESEKLKTESLLGGIGKVEENTRKIAELLQEQNKALGIADVKARVQGKLVPKENEDRYNRESTVEELVNSPADGVAWGKGAAAAVPLNSSEAESFMGTP